MKRLSPTLLLLGAAAAATPEELALASEELQDGTLDAEGLNIFRQHAAQHPGDWRAHGMLGQALAQKGLPGALGALRTASKLAPGVGQLALALAETLSAGSGEGVAEEAVRAFRRALRLTPALGSASVYTRLGIALAGAELSAEPAAVEETDEAVRAWTTSVALDPRGVQTQILLARRLSHGSSGAQRAQATRAAKAAVRLDPRSASAYDALGGALLTARNASSLSSTKRNELVAALRTAIALREAAPAPSTPAGGRQAAAVDDAAAPRCTLGGTTRLTCTYDAS